MLFALLAFLLLTATTFALPTNSDGNSLDTRQTGCMGSSPCILLEGNGDPHQKILHKQLSVWMDCGGTTCGVTEDQQQSYTLTAESHGLPFTTGDFEVSQSVDTGTYDGCTAGLGHRVCVWSTIWFTDFTVRAGRKNNCFVDCQTGDETTIIRAPNTINNGVEYYCAYDNDCGDQGQEFWIDGPAMGPPLSTALAERQSGDIALFARQGRCVSHRCASLVGNGDPHQQLLHKQLSVWVDCAGANCAVSPEEQQSYTLEADTHGAVFIDGGFDVQRSVDTGIFEQGCSAGPGQRVCVWATIWFTDYTVAAGTTATCFGGCRDTTNVIIRAPNTLYDYVEYYCAYDNDCGDQGQEYVILGPASGPLTILDKRQNCIPAGSCTQFEGNGDPDQWILHKQLSAKEDCGDDYCVISENEQVNYSIRAETHGLDWINGGFEVAQSVQTGIHNGCTGGGSNPGRSVCTKAVIWHTDYTVRGGIANSCDPDGCISYDYTTVIRSPNKITRGVEYYCAYDDDCGVQGDELWIAAQAGPPPKSEVPI